MADALFPDLTNAQTAEVTRLIGEIDEFKGHWRRVSELRAERLAALRQVTTIESTGSSTRIEGAELSDADVARVLEGLHVDSFRARAESEVLGYGELVTLICESWREIPLSENHLKQLHGVLLKHSSKDERHRGEYKKFPNNVEARYEDGRTELIFETVTPFDTPRRMTELIVLTNDTLTAATLHPLVTIARFIVDFLAIHPFQDGNGRLARAVTTLLMLRAGYDYAPYSSLERIIEENKLGYYTALRESQLAMRDTPAAFGAWLLYFLRALRAQQKSLDVKLRVERSLLDLSDAQQRVTDFVTANGRITSPAIGWALGMPNRTVRYHMRILVDRGILEAHGEKKGRYYTRAVAGDATMAPSERARTNDILAEIYHNGGRVSEKQLMRLITQQGYKARMAGILRGRRVLKRDPTTGDAVLTARGEELARQHIFAARLAAGAARAGSPPEA